MMTFSFSEKTKSETDPASSQTDGHAATAHESHAEQSDEEGRSVSEDAASSTNSATTHSTGGSDSDRETRQDQTRMHHGFPHQHRGSIASSRLPMQGPNHEPDRDRPNERNETHHNAATPYPHPRHSGRSRRSRPPAMSPATIGHGSNLSGVSEQVSAPHGPREEQRAAQHGPLAGQHGRLEDPLNPPAREADHRERRGSTQPPPAPHQTNPEGPRRTEAVEVGGTEERNEPRQHR